MLEKTRLLDVGVLEKTTGLEEVGILDIPIDEVGIFERIILCDEDGEFERPFVAEIGISDSEMLLDDIVVSVTDVLGEVTGVIFSEAGTLDRTISLAGGTLEIIILLEETGTLESIMLLEETGIFVRDILLEEEAVDGRPSICDIP